MTTHFRALNFLTPAERADYDRLAELGYSRDERLRSIRRADLVGWQPEPKVRPRKGQKFNRKPVVFKGREYPSGLALAQEIGVSPSTVASAIKQGRLDTLGIGRGKAPRRNNVKPAACGWEWPSQSAAARDLVVAYNTVSHHLRCGTFADLVLRRLGPKGGAA